jgi:hypothetical protein
VSSGAFLHGTPIATGSLYLPQRRAHLLICVPQDVCSTQSANSLSLHGRLSHTDTATVPGLCEGGVVKQTKFVREWEDTACLHSQDLCIPGTILSRSPSGELHVAISFGKLHAADKPE